AVDGRVPGSGVSESGRGQRADGAADGHVAVDVDDHVGLGVGVDADRAGGAELGEHGVGLDAACEVVHVAGERTCFVAGVDGAVALGVGAHGGHVEQDGGCVGGDVAAAGDLDLLERAGGESAECLVVAVDGRVPRSGIRQSRRGQRADCAADGHVAVDVDHYVAGVVRVDAGRTLVPYTTLFRSGLDAACEVVHVAGERTCFV